MKTFIGVVVLLLVSGCGLSLQRLPLDSGLPGDTYGVTMVFADVASLPVGGQVRVGQAVVGRIESMSTRDFQAHVRVRMDAGVPLPREVTANIEVAAALGEQFIALTVPEGQSAGRLGDGDVIDVRHTSRGPEVEDMLATIGTMLGGSGLDQLGTIVRETNAALGGREQQVRDLFGELDRLLGALDAHRADIDRALDSLNALTGTVNAERDTLHAALTEIRPAVEVLVSQQDSFTTLLTHVDSLSTVTDDVLDRTQDQLVDRVATIRPILDELAGLDADLGALLTAMDAFAPLFERAVPSDYLQLDAELNVSGTLVSLLTGATAMSSLPLGAPPPGGLEELLEAGTR